MSRYRMRQATVEAFQNDANMANRAWPMWLRAAFMAGDVVGSGGPQLLLTQKSVQDPVIVELGDWLVLDRFDEIQKVGASDFPATYAIEPKYRPAEPAEESDDD